MDEPRLISELSFRPGLREPQHTEFTVTMYVAGWYSIGGEPPVYLEAGETVTVLDPADATVRSVPSPAPPAGTEPPA